MERRVYTVSELTAYLQGRIESDPVLQGLWLEGEISNFTHHSSGHMYFTLKDGGARLRCVMFRSSNARLRFRPHDGMAVTARGSVTVYPKNGDYQLYVDAMEPSGMGSLFVAFEQLKARLESEGLFDQGRKKPIPPMPSCVAVVTSPTGAAVRDIVKVLRRRRGDLDILLIPAQVQGDEAPAGIIRSLALVRRLPRVDVVIVGRGGGSIEELWAFNDEGVARAIAACPVPVISAVGHETDFTIADFVADLRAPTPSAAAEMATADGAHFCQLFNTMVRRMSTSLRQTISTHRKHLARLSGSPALTRPAKRLSLHRQEVDALAARLARSMHEGTALRRHRLAASAGRLQALSPLSTLSRGYSICTTGQGILVRKASQVAPGGRVNVLLHQGSLDCLVERVEEGEKHEP